MVPPAYEIEWKEWEWSLQDVLKSLHSLTHPNEERSFLSSLFYSFLPLLFSNAFLFSNSFPGIGEEEGMREETDRSLRHVLHPSSLFPFISCLHQPILIPKVGLDPWSGEAWREKEGMMEWGMARRKEDIIASLIPFHSIPFSVLTWPEINLWILDHRSGTEIRNGKGDRAWPNTRFLTVKPLLSISLHLSSLYLPCLFFPCSCS